MASLDNINISVNIQKLPSEDWALLETDTAQRATMRDILLIASRTHLDEIIAVREGLDGLVRKFSEEKREELRNVLVNALIDAANPLGGCYAIGVDADVSSS